MIRRLLIPLLGSGLLLAAGAGSALAKCEGPNPPDFCSQVVASMDFGSAGATARAGIETPVRVWVSRGEQPTEASGITLIFARIADATVVRAEAQPSAEAGLWRVNVNLPRGGGWTVVAEVTQVDGTLVRLNLDWVLVATGPSAPRVAPLAAPISPAPPAWPIALVLAGVVASGLLAVRARQRSRRGAMAAQALAERS
jgi:hypothetical protein